MSPRHRARHLSGRSTGPSTDAAEASQGAGLAARLRRHPQLKRHAALGSIAVGTTLFVAVSLTTQLAGAQTGHTQPQSRARVPNTASTPPDLSVLAPVIDTAPTATATATPAAGAVAVAV
ncbi:MAG: hypothetical protein ABI429_08800, partial [Jatrophihabitantaceae bacterium]